MKCLNRTAELMLGLQDVLRDAAQCPTCTSLTSAATEAFPLIRELRRVLPSEAFQLSDENPFQQISTMETAVLLAITGGGLSQRQGDILRAASILRDMLLVLCGDRSGCDALYRQAEMITFIINWQNQLQASGLQI